MLISIIDYIGYILFRVFGFMIRSLPLRWGLFIGRRVGDCLFFLDAKHRAIAYSNLKTAFADKKSDRQLAKLTREFYRCFGQNLIEIFFIPLVNKEYLDKYIKVEGLENIKDAFARGKGVILLGVHGGSWELSNILSANVGFPFSLLVAGQQRYKRMSNLLDTYRSQKGCRLIHRDNQTRELIELLKKNEAIGMTADQGGKNGHLVKFFGKNASMATGAVRMGLKYGATIIPAIYARVKGPYIKIILESPFELKITGDRENDLHQNLQQLAYIFEKYISIYPQEYLWSYRIWKYTDEKNILILSDGKAGHLRQAQALAGIISASSKEKGNSCEIEVFQVGFRGRIAKGLLSLTGCLAGKYSCQGCLGCLRRLLKGEDFDLLIKRKPDIIISCAGSLATVNYLLSKENLAKSVVIMRPAFLSTRKFDLAVIPKHDNPPRRKNIVRITGALNLINQQYLNEQSKELVKSMDSKLITTNSYIGLLIGGDTKIFCLKKEKVYEIIKQLKQISEQTGANILVTTSRRTSEEIEGLLKNEFREYLHCGLLIIANENNIPEAVGGILGLSRFIVCSPESISMISEAASSGKYVIVFESDGLGKKHQRFLDHLAREKYIYLVKPQDLGRKLQQIMQDRPPIKALDDAGVVREAIGRIL